MLQENNPSGMCFLQMGYQFDFKADAKYYFEKDLGVTFWLLVLWLMNDVC